MKTHVLHICPCFLRGAVLMKGRMTEPDFDPVQESVTWWWSSRNAFQLCLEMLPCECLHTPCRCVRAHLLHADCWKSAGGNTFLIKFSEADIFALQPAEWFHMCFFAKSEFSCNQQDSCFLAARSSFCHQGGEVILTVWITSNWS